MRAVLILMAGTFFWFMTPAISDAHQVKQGKDHDRRGYSQKHDDHQRSWSRYQQHDRHHQKSWKKQRKAEKRWARRYRHQAPVKVIYRERRAYPLFPRIVINIPL